MEKIASSHGYDLYHVILNGRSILRLVSLESLKSADYLTVDLVNSSGVVQKQEVSDELIPAIITNFLSHGPTDAFTIYSDSVSGVISENDVLHNHTSAESNFTSTGSKLTAHNPIFSKLKDTGYGSIIRATMTLHQVCSSRCSFCSTINRNNSDKTSLQEAISFVNSLYYDQAEFNRCKFPFYNQLYRAQTGSDIRLKGLILSGGGQPNLWPHFAEFVSYLSELNLDLGLITNGFPQNIPENIYKHFRWIRISITPPEASPHYTKGFFENQYIPSSLHGDNVPTVGLSYVYGPWTSDDTLLRLNDYASKYNYQYVRVLVDCNLSRSKQLLAHQQLAIKLRSLGLTNDMGIPLGKIFHQLKYHMNPSDASVIWPDGQCLLQSYNVFWDTTGHDANGYSYCYPCDSVTVLSEDDGQYSSRGFDSSIWGTVKNTEVYRLYQEPLQRFFDTRITCKACLFHKNNLEVRRQMDLQLPPNPSLYSTTSHVNFP